MSDFVIHVDENDNELGLVPREKAHAEGLLHRIAVVYLLRPNGDILIQERISGRLDHSSAGHVDPEETYQQAAKRELEEELGVSGIALHEVGRGVSYDTETGKPHGGATHIYAVFSCVAEPGVLNPDEVKSVRWASPGKILEDMRSDPEDKKYTGGFKSTLQLLMQPRTE